MKNTAVFSADGRLNTKLARVQTLRRTTVMDDVPLSYKSNTTKEELCFEYIHSFNDQFESIYPKRRMPYMTAENEFGVKKFVCSTIRPTLLPITELCDIYECASFLAGYVVYEPLENLSQPPSTLVSPTMTLQEHTGDCFDMAVLLCSFLCAYGYDAYVVYGYAPRYIALKDQSQTLCPLMTNITETSSSFEDEEEPEAALHKVVVNRDSYAEMDGVSNPYVPPDNGVKDSKYIAEQREKDRIAALDPFVLWIDGTGKGNPITGLANADKDSVQSLASSTCVHAWVLVRAGKRDIKEHVFLEPSTGRAYGMQNSPYVGIESVWNHQNFWIYVSNNPENCKIGEIDFDFTNANCWEYLFVNSKNKGSLQNVSNQDHADEGKGEGNPVNLDLPMEKYLDPPPSWVMPLSIERRKLLLRFPPSGKRTVYYLRAKVDYFARNTHNQGMTMRVTTYLDNERVVVKEIHEWFENRADRLYKRVRHMLDSYYFVEHFHPGSVGEVKRWLEYPGKKTDILFHVNGRIDRLKRRIDIFDMKSQEYFENRMDRLVYRATYLNTDKSSSGGRYSLSGYSNSVENYVLKMIQIYDRSADSSAGNDVAKRVFHVKESKVIVQYHYAAGKITSLVKTYNHRSGATVSTAANLIGAGNQAREANSAPGTAMTMRTSSAVSVLSQNNSNNYNLNDDNPQDDDPDGTVEAASLERECYTAIKAAHAQIQDIHKSRATAEAKVPIERTVFEAAFEGVDSYSEKERKQADEGGVESKGIDYLTPYLRHIPDIGKITKEEALEIRQVCLDALKARLVERANIIQSRLNDENSKLARKQEQFQRSQREGELSTDEYEKYCTEAMFRIQILEERLNKHEEAALKKFAELDSKLALDPRLKILRNV